MTSRCEESSCFGVDFSFKHCPIAQAPARATIGYSRNSVKHLGATMNASFSLSAKVDLCWPSFFSYVVIHLLLCTC